METRQMGSREEVKYSEDSVEKGCRMRRSRIMNKEES
jgi:hypothetical protein